MTDEIKQVDSPEVDKGLRNRLQKKLSQTSRKYDVDNDGKLDDVELAMRKMDSGDVGHLSNEKVYKILMDQTELQKAVFSMKRVGLVLLGLVCVLALSTLGTSFAAAKLAQDTKISVSGELTDADTGNIIFTRARGSKITVTINSDFVSQRRRHLLGNRKLASNAAMIGTVPSNAVEDAYDAFVSDATPVAVSGTTASGTTHFGQVSASGLSVSTTDGITRYSGVHAVDVPTPTYYVECQENETTCNIYEDESLERVNLGSADTFAILTKTGVTTTGVTSVTGDIGASPIALSAVTGFALTTAGPHATSAMVTGKVYASDLAPPTPINMGVAVNDMMTAYNDAAGRTTPDHTNLGGAIISGAFAPGLYKWTTAVTVPADVEFDGSATDIWIIQIAGGVTVESDVRITLAGGALAKNIFWQVAGAVTVGNRAHLEGIYLTSTGMIFTTGSSLNGAALAQTAVTLDATTIVKKSATADY